MAEFEETTLRRPRGGGLTRVRLPVVFALMSLTGLSSCSNLLTDDCSVKKQLASPGGGHACSAAKAERTVLFSGDDHPRLWTGENERTAPNVDASALDRAPTSSAGRVGGGVPAGPPAVGFFGTLRVVYPLDPDKAAQDVVQIRGAGARSFDPDAHVAVNFNRATLDFFLKQLLGGALGVNYVAPDGLGGSITFRTEQPLPKGQVLDIVRDVLGRNGLGMVYQNGVYQIADADTLKQMTAADKIGGDKATRVVRVKRGSAAELVGLARQLAPGDVNITPTNTNDAVIVQANSSNLDAAVELVNSLVADGVGEDKMALIPVRQAPPEAIAAQVEAFYQGRMGKAGDITIIPLAMQQALLVGTHDPRLMAGLRQLVAQLDHATKAEASVRILQLHFLSAADVATQLATLFGATASGGGAATGASSAKSLQNLSGASPYGSLASGGNGGAAGSGGSSAGSTSLSSANNFGSGASSSGGSNAQGGGDAAVSAASYTPSSSAGGADGPRSGRGGPSGGPSGVPGAGSTPAETVKFVADTRNNTIMVYSSYEIFQRARDVLKTIDVPQAQVVIEATIVDVTLNDELQYGVQWFLSGHGMTLRSSQSTSTADPGTAGGFASIGASVGGMTANVLLNALQSITTVKIISSPYLTVVDGKEARLVVGTQIPFTTTTQNASSGGTSTVTNATSLLDTGVILDFTPSILSNNSVNLKIDQEVTTPDSSVSDGNTTPTISTRSVKSDVIVQSGRTIVLGGMIQESSNRTESGTPVAQALPIIGNLFKTKTDTGNRTELLVMITPRVVRQSNQLEAVTRTLRDQLHVN